MRIIQRSLAIALAASLCASGLSAQKAKPKLTSTGKAKPAIFAVIYSGATIEPIAIVDNGKLLSGAGDPASENSDLANNYYKVGTKYTLIFGGVPNGTVSITKSNVGTECGGASADISVQSAKKLSGFVMGLATNITPKTKGSGVRRTPNATEKTEVEALVRAEYAKHKVPASAAKQLRYHNLTAMDVDGDGNVELIGSYWVAPKTKERDLLFFIAAKSAAGKYAFNYSDFQVATPDKVMSGELKDIEDGVYQTLLLDAFDYDNDGVAEIFTLSKAFEGNNYSAFKRENGKWTKVLDAYDYRCGY